MLGQATTALGYTTMYLIGNPFQMFSFFPLNFHLPLAYTLTHINTYQFVYALTLCVHIFYN